VDPVPNADQAESPIIDIKIGKDTNPDLRLEKRATSDYYTISERQIDNVDSLQVPAPQRSRFGPAAEAPESGSDSGEEYFGEDEESMRFVEQGELKAVKKELDEQHRVNETLRSLITELQVDLRTFKEKINPTRPDGDSFSFKIYARDLEKKTKKFGTKSSSM